MTHPALNPKQHAHELIERMAPTQLAALVGLLEIMLDPIARSLADAPPEDEVIGDEENRAVAASKDWLQQNEPIPHETVLAEFGLIADDSDQIRRTPRESTGTDR